VKDNGGRCAVVRLAHYDDDAIAATQAAIGNVRFRFLRLFARLAN
jgi:hypothetical protein